MSDADVLAYNPFEGDFGNPGDRLLKDHMVVARKDHDECHTCTGSIAKGERHRHRVEINYGHIESWRWCAVCCEAMAASWTDDGKAIEARYELRFNQQVAV